MQVVKRTGVLLVAAVMSTGCVIAVTDDGIRSTRSESGWEARQQMNRTVIHGLAMGTALEDVHKQLGDPDFSEAFRRDDGDYRVFLYRTHHVKSDGKTTRDETTPVVFRDGVVVGFGDDFYRRIVSP